ncbi:MAG: HlyD family efflux transporter periplasmic adaptor subunit [Fuerstiella sp.]
MTNPSCSKLASASAMKSHRSHKRLPAGRSPRSLKRRGVSKTLLVFVGAVIVAGAIFALPQTREYLAKQFSSEASENTSAYVLHKAEKGPFRITITENGTIDSLQNSVLKSLVEGSTDIISLVPEGSRVQGPTIADFDGMIKLVEGESGADKLVELSGENGETKTYEVSFGEFTELLVIEGQKIRAGDYIAGDLVCELNSSPLEESLQQQKINVTTAKADYEKAQKELQIQESTNESLLAQAKLAEELAALDSDKYTAPGGEYEQAKQTIDGDIKRLQEELAQSQEQYEKVRDQARRGYQTLSALEQARIKVTQQDILLKQKSSELNLLMKFTFDRTTRELKQMAEDTKRETKRVILEGEAQIATDQADLDARKLTLQVETEKLDRLERQIVACRLIAPQPGEVVYASQQSRRSEPVVIEEGASVRERQAVINLPNLDQMKVDARIHESRISRISVGQPVEIYVDAVEDVSFRGVLDNVSAVPVPGSWPNTDLKEYEAAIRITDGSQTVRKLKPGMTAEIRIIVDDREEDVMQIPVQSVLSVANKYFTYVVKDKRSERRELKVGDANDEYIEILDGVSPGEEVVMNPRTHFSREINELEIRLLEQQEEGRERISTPPLIASQKNGPASGARPGAGRPAGRPGGAAAGRPGAGAGQGGGRPSPAQMFSFADKNKDGFITKEESDFRGKFDQYDADANGKVTVEELTTATSKT